MGRREAEKAMKELLISCYGHYSRQEEHKLITAFLQGQAGALPDLTMNEFPLAKEPLRSIKNGMICLVAVLCRYAADLGANDERSYALSDYYINEIENSVTLSNWRELLVEIARHYMELVRTGREEHYSLTVSRAVRYIHQHLYEPCRLKDVAAALQVNPSYLSTLFKTETGSSLTHYVTKHKITEAQSLLLEDGHSINEIADLLGFGSISYFSKVFRSVNSCSPLEYLKNHHL